MQSPNPFIALSVLVAVSAIGALPAAADSNGYRRPQAAQPSQTIPLDSALSAPSLATESSDSQPLGNQSSSQPFKQQSQRQQSQRVSRQSDLLDQLQTESEIRQQLNQSRFRTSDQPLVPETDALRYDQQVQQQINLQNMRTPSTSPSGMLDRLQFEQRVRQRLQQTTPAPSPESPVQTDPPNQLAQATGRRANQQQADQQTGASASPQTQLAEQPQAASPDRQDAAAQSSAAQTPTANQPRPAGAANSASRTASPSANRSTSSQARPAPAASSRAASNQTASVRPEPGASGAAPAAAPTAPAPTAPAPTAAAPTARTVEEPGASAETSATSRLTPPAEAETREAKPAAVPAAASGTASGAATASNPAPSTPAESAASPEPTSGPAAAEVSAEPEVKPEVKPEASAETAPASPEPTATSANPTPDPNSREARQARLEARREARRQARREAAAAREAAQANAARSDEAQPGSTQPDEIQARSAETAGAQPGQPQTGELPANEQKAETSSSTASEAATSEAAASSSTTREPAPSQPQSSETAREAEVRNGESEGTTAKPAEVKPAEASSAEANPTETSPTEAATGETSGSASPVAEASEAGSPEATGAEATKPESAEPTATASETPPSEAAASETAEATPNSGTPAAETAQTPTVPLESQPLDLPGDAPTPSEPPRPGDPGRSDRIDPGENIFSAEDFSTDAAAPDYLDPDPNPLSFPTQPDEVEIVGTQPITLRQAIQLALRNNPTLRQAQFELERSQADLRRAEASNLPTLDAQAGFNQSGSETGSTIPETFTNSVTGEEQPNVVADPDNPTQTIPNPRIGDVVRTYRDSTTLSVGIELNYNIFTSGQRPALIRAAERQVRLQQLDLERQTEQLILDTVGDYYNLQQAGAQVNIFRANLAQAEQSLRDAQALERAGVGTRFDVLQAEVDVANARQRLTQQLSDLEVSQRQISQRLNISQSLDVSAADPIEVAGVWDLSLEESIVEGFKNRAELEQQLVQREIAEQNRRAALADLGPQVGFQGAFNVSSEDFELNGGPNYNYSLALNARMRLFDGGEARSRANAQESNISIAEAAFEAAKEQIRFDIERGYSQLNASFTNIQTTALAVEQATEALRLARLRFQAGVGTQTDVLRQQSVLAEAQVNNLTAILDYNRALAVLQRGVSNYPEGFLNEQP